MFYEPRNGHGLPHDPFKAIIAPRPIGWISTVSPDGDVNLAPYSYFNAFCDRPPIVGFSSGGRKDSQGEFVANLATRRHADAMNRSSAPVPAHVNEMELAGLTPAPSRIVKPPRVADAPAAAIVPRNRRRSIACTGDPQKPSRRFSAIGTPP